MSNFTLDNIRAAAAACKAGKTSSMVEHLSKALSLILESSEVEYLDSYAYADIPDRLEDLAVQLEAAKNLVDEDD